jgi:hypothetical protein
MLQLLAVFVLRRREGGKWGREGWDWNPSPCMPHDPCQTKPINQLKSIQRMKATYSDFIPYATAT